MNRSERSDIEQQCSGIIELHPEMHEEIDVLLDQLHTDEDAPYEVYQNRVYELYRACHRHEGVGR